MSTTRTQAMFYYEDIKPEMKKSRFPFINYFRERFNIGKFNPEESRKAVVQKSGHYRVKYSGLKQYRGKFLQDLYITLIDLQWRYAYRHLIQCVPRDLLFLCHHVVLDDVQPW
ncbi:hypothetical protein FSP39_004869 [Pinctada imbricata]|uniref:Potassium channel inwardly rectifying transmembrane domain-containing protein n=1 Tax=Pinctada imbricata TaxID=66713 RepID=A0AA88XG55_PINIB|nr:hypothetical protein FSP39_004869 [Pinctada imbricata]